MTWKTAISVYRGVRLFRSPTKFSQHSGGTFLYNNLWSTHRITLRSSVVNHARPASSIWTSQFDRSLQYTSNCLWNLYPNLFRLWSFSVHYWSGIYAPPALHRIIRGFQCPLNIILFLVTYTPTAAFFYFFVASQVFSTQWDCRKTQVVDCTLHWASCFVFAALERPLMLGQWRLG